MWCRLVGRNWTVKFFLNALSFISGDILVNSPIDITITEVHNLAYFYHWGAKECWELPCTERRVFNDRIRRQLKAESNGGKDSGNSNKNSSYKENIDNL